MLPRGAELTSFAKKCSGIQPSRIPTIRRVFCWDNLIYGCVCTYGPVHIYGRGRIYGRHQIYGRDRIYGSIRLYGRHCIYLYTDVSVRMDASVYMEATVYTNATVYIRTRPDIRLVFLGLSYFLFVWRVQGLNFLFRSFLIRRWAVWLTVANPQNAVRCTLHHKMHKAVC